MTRHDFTDDGGTSAELAVYTSSDHPDFVAIRTTDPVRLAPRTLPRFIAALYAAAGKPEPVILDRPDIDPQTCKGVNLFNVWLDRDRNVYVGRGGNDTGLAPSVARLLACLIAAYADAAEREPDPAEVEELATLLHDTRETGVKGGHGEWDVRDARAILRAGYKREANPQ